MRTMTIIFLLIILASLMLYSNNLIVSASEINGVPLLEEIDLPSDLNFSVSNTFNGNAYFEQASANKNGCFAIFCHHIDREDYTNVDYSKVYIDIYNPDGTFMQELTFNTKLDFAFELDEKNVIFYFYTTILVYEFETQELSHYLIPKGAATNGDTYKRLRSERFTAGEWEYTCKKGFNGYVELCRSNGKQKQVLLEMPGNYNMFWEIILPGVVAGVIILLASLCIYKRKTKTKNSFKY